MELAMFTLRHDDKVFETVVKSITVPVMDNLLLAELPSYPLFHNVAMFVDALTFNSNLSVAISNYRPLAMGIDLSEQWITETPESLVMDIAKSFGFVLSMAPVNGTFESGFTFEHSVNTGNCSRFSKPLVMFRAETNGDCGFATTIDRACDFFQDVPPCQCVFTLYHETAHNVKRASSKHRVNSGKPLTDNAEGNPEPSQKYTSGRCRDYRRGKVPLMTG
jgi:hypothetical protein